MSVGIGVMPPDDRFRLHLALTGAHQELIDHLTAVPARDRAERLRLLATIGLAVLTGQAAFVPAGAVVAAPASPAPAKPNDPKSEMRKELMNRLARSLNEG